MGDQTDWIPTPDEQSAPFFAGARDGKLMLQHCNACQRWLHPVRSRCPLCASTDLEWAKASGRGVVYSHGLLQRASHPRHEGRLPIVLAVIDLEEGVRFSSNLVEVEPERVRAGMPVEVAFEPVSEAALPVFRPVDPTFRREG